MHRPEHIISIEQRMLPTIAEHNNCPKRIINAILELASLATMLQQIDIFVYYSMRQRQHFATQKPNRKTILTAWHPLFLIIIVLMLVLNKRNEQRLHQHDDHDHDEQIVFMILLGIV